MSFLYDNQGSRLLSNWEPRLYTNWESRLNSTEVRGFHLISVITASIRVVFSHIQGVCPCFCNLFNSTLARAIYNSTNSTVHRQANQSSWQALDWVSKILVTIFPGGFRQFNSILMKTTTQTGSNSRHLTRLPGQSWEAEIQIILKYFQINLKCQKLLRVFCRLSKNHQG